MSIRILLIEDDELFRLGLKVRLQQEPDLEIVAEAEDGETGIELAGRLPLDIVLLDVGLPGIGGIEACKQIKRRHGDLPVLVLTSHSQSALITRLVAAGAQGYCLKGIAAETLILALHSLAAGASWWDATATQTIRTELVLSDSGTPVLSSSKENLVSSVRNSHAQALLENPLTQREQEILELITMGQSNSEIAKALYITAGTVRVHVHSILQKLGVRDRTQAAMIALKYKQLPGDNAF
jgi:two-component system NarL family response regulator